LQEEQEQEQEQETELEEDQCSKKRRLIKKGNGEVSYRGIFERYPSKMRVGF
jgi:hypothetical protein